MDPLEFFRGERRFVSVELAASLAAGDALSGTPTVAIVVKRGRAPTTMVSTPAPAVDTTAVEFWVDVPEDQDRGGYLALVSCGTTNGETVIEEAPILVQ